MPQINIFDPTYSDGLGTSSYLYYNRTRSADDVPHTEQYFNIDNIIHNNMLKMTNGPYASGTFTDGNRYYSRTKGDLSYFNNSLIESVKTANTMLQYISLVGNESYSNILLNSIAQTEYPVYYPIPVEFAGFNGISSDNNTYNSGYADGFVPVKYYTNTSSSGKYHIDFNGTRYDYSSPNEWRNGQITLSAGSNYTYYLCTSLSLKQKYYVWSETDTVSFDVVVYLFNNLGHSTTGFPWRNASYLTQGTPITKSNYKYTMHTVGSYTLSLNNECKINANTIRSKINTGNTLLKSGTTVYFGHGYSDSNKSTNKFSFDPTKWGYFLINGVDSPLPKFISSHVCTTNNYGIKRNYRQYACSNISTNDTNHFCNIPIIIKGTKTQETGSTNDSRPVFYSVGFIGLSNVKYNIGISSTQHWSNPLPNDAITYYKYLCLEEYDPNDLSLFNGRISTTSTNSYFMINNSQNMYIVNSSYNEYIQNQDYNNYCKAVILSSYSYAYSYV